MTTLKIDHFDTQYAYCTDREKKLFAIALDELPHEAKKGDILLIDDDGKLQIQR